MDGQKQEHETESTKKHLFRKDGELYRMARAVSLFCGVGFFLGSNICVCIWLGMKFDEHFQTAPKGLLTGIFLGFPTAIASLWKKMSKKG